MLIPIFNDWESILKLLENINSEIINLDHEFTVIIVDDASTINSPTFENKYGYGKMLIEQNISIDSLLNKYLFKRKFMPLSF